MNFEELQEKVLDWADDKDLLHEENADKQFMKFIEEVFEFRFEMQNRANYQKAFKNLKCDGSYVLGEDKVDMELEMGDILVTLIILCEQLGIDPIMCLHMAYIKIRKRKGKTIDGTFVKEEDL